MNEQPNSRLSPEMILLQDFVSAGKNFERFEALFIDKIRTALGMVFSKSPTKNTLLNNIKNVQISKCFDPTDPKEEVAFTEVILPLHVKAESGSELDSELAPVGVTTLEEVADFSVTNTEGEWVIYVSLSVQAVLEELANQEVKEA